MRVTYTNRNWITFYLCQGVTKTGKTRYFFARQAKGKPVERIPKGYVIRESVKGVVSLAKSEPELIEPCETTVVEEALRLHPRAHNYRLNIKRNMIEIFERVGPDADELIREFDKIGLGSRKDEQIKSDLEQHSRFAPVLRFVLVNAQDRTFAVERMGYSGRGGWLNLYASGNIEPLARKWIPKLGTIALFESFGPD
ncbi:MAG: hypothetical protein M1570_18100 [Chloroflexi bacterium]|nr:hypothetical protein [Chloroflexota bacterium]